MPEPSGTKRKRSTDRIRHDKNPSTDEHHKKIRKYPDNDADTLKTGHEVDKSDTDQDVDELEEASDSSSSVADEDKSDEAYESDEANESNEAGEDNRSDVEFGEELPWLKSICFPIRHSTAPESPQIGYCSAKLIDREPIRANFHRDMEEPSRDTATLGFDVFDRWGNLKSEFQDHPVKKGTGVWGRELNYGRILLIESIVIDEGHQRQRFGRKAFNEVWERAQSLAMLEDNERIAARKKHLNELWEKTRDPSDQSNEKPDNFDDIIDKVSVGAQQPVTFGCDFAVVRATILDITAVEEEAEKLAQPDKESFYARKQQVLEDYWRALGFRRIGSSPFFCYANDPTHASRLLAAENDYRRPEGSRFDARLETGQELPYNETLRSASDSETKSILENRLNSYAASDFAWLATDRNGNNILHIVARDRKATSIAWLLEKPFAGRLQSARNHEGETPVEVLESVLEAQRAYRVYGSMQVVMHDLFSGFTPTQVACVSQLRGIANPISSENAKLTFGCTCGQCLGGFMSPRTAFALECQGDVHGDRLSGDCFPGPISSGEEWYHWNDSLMGHLSQGVKGNMQTNKSLRQGFAKVFGYIAETLRAKKIPIANNVLQFAVGEWSPHMRNYLQRGGTVLAVLQACFDCAMNEDLYLGNGEHETYFGETIKKLPNCRNDREFVFVRRQMRKLEGLPDEVNPRVGMGGIW